jgi:hypothetical protein
MAERDLSSRDFDDALGKVADFADKMSNQGEAVQEIRPVSLSGMVSTLVPVAITAAVYFLIFIILRRSQRRYYAPRSYIGSLRENERTPALPGGYLNWLGRFWKIPDSLALQTQSLDSYLYLRFIRVRPPAPHQVPSTESALCTDAIGR